MSVTEELSEKSPSVTEFTHCAKETVLWIESNGIGRIIEVTSCPDKRVENYANRLRR